MPRFLIEIPHEDEHAACVRALQALDTHGSHFVTHAEFGCRDGFHSALLTAEFESLAEARQIVPPEFRREARIVRLERFTREQIAAMIEDLET
jgi:hypothetical protein